MDRLDRIAMAGLAVLLVGSGILIVQHRHEPPSGIVQVPKSIPVQDPAAAADLDKASKVIRSLIDAQNMGQAESMLRDLMAKYPFQGEPHLLMGDVLLRRQDPVGAMHEYRQAIELNPDYLDRKTPQFQGKKLKNAVGEALAEIESRIRQDPADQALKAEKKNIYYLYRLIAGSCG